MLLRLMYRRMFWFWPRLCSLQHLALNSPSASPLAPAHRGGACAATSAHRGHAFGRGSTEEFNLLPDYPLRNNMSDEDPDSKVIDTSVIIPVDQDGEAIIGSGNPAEYSGLLDSVMEWMIESGHHLPMVEHGAVQLGSVLAIDVPTAISFMDGTHNDPHDLKSPCPVGTAARIVAFTARTGVAVAAVAGIPPALSRQYSCAAYSVKTGDAALLKTLAHVIQHADNLSEMKQAAAGSGRRLAIAMMAAHRACLPSEQSLVKAKLDSVKQQGVHGEVTAKSLTSFLKAYKKAKQCVEGPLRPDAASSLAMMNLIAYKDPGIRDAYELRTVVAPPATAAEAKTLIMSILRNRVTMEKIDQVGSGAEPAALATPAAPQPAAPSPSDITLAAAQAAQRKAEAALAAMQAVDPTKNSRRGARGGRGDGRGRGRGRGRGDKAPAPAAAPPADKVKAPRDENGNVTHWIKGMPPCTCGKEHLFRDCPDNQEAQVTQLQPEEQPQECDAEPGYLATELHAFFDAAEPARAGGAMGLVSVAGSGKRSKSLGVKKCIISYTRPLKTALLGRTKNPVPPEGAGTNSSAGTDVVKFLCGVSHSRTVTENPSAAFHGDRRDFNGGATEHAALFSGGTSRPNWRGSVRASLRGVGSAAARRIGSLRSWNNKSSETAKSPPPSSTIHVVQSELCPPATASAATAHSRRSPHPPWPLTSGTRSFPRGWWRVYRTRPRRSAT